MINKYLIFNNIIVNCKNFFKIIVFYLIIFQSNLFAGILRNTTFDDRVDCESSFGVWREFGNSCVDKCEFQFDKYVVCASAISFGCECGNDRCLYKDKCINNVEYEKIYLDQQAQLDLISQEEKEKRAKIALRFKNSYINKLSGIYSQDPNYRDPNRDLYKKELPNNTFVNTNRSLIYNDLVKKKNEKIMLIRKKYEDQIATLKQSENPDKDLINQLSKSLEDNKIIQYVDLESKKIIKNSKNEMNNDDIQKEPIVLTPIEDSKKTSNNELIDKLSKALNPKDTQDMLSKFINNDNSSKQDKNINELPPVYIRDQNGDQDFKNKKVIDNSETFPQFIN